MVHIHSEMLWKAAWIIHLKALPIQVSVGINQKVSFTGQSLVYYGPLNAEVIQTSQKLLYPGRRIILGFMLHWAAL